LSSSHGQDDDVTRLADGGAGTRPSAVTSTNPAKSSAPPSSGGGNPSSSSSGASTGWLTSSGAIDHGRFAPGTILGSRYRIVGRLGRGGMGEVYRADDLKLGQPVALKFLPPEVDRDPARLTQLHTEVRMARLVSHPNVCRVYDIDEVDGHTFLSMEFVDGEDLAALLRRIGHFPEERGLQIARQICAGLAAAHERGVIHRDFKPANVMLDAGGKVRITDFGLAGVTGESIRAGTPAYMAPEQLAGSEVTARSDIYALGLVLYELFTGRRALEGKNVAELIRKREQVGIARPSSIVPEMSHDVERAIMVCLRPEPDERPASALVVAAALPGGDPLAAALAAGETPSPEMVAAAGGTEAVSMRATMLTAAWIVVSLLMILAIYQRVMMINRIATPKTPEALEDRAIEALAKLGYTDPPFATARGLSGSMDFANYILNTSQAPDRWDLLRRQRPETLVFWRRTSPQALVPFGTNPIGPQNPPHSLSGMTTTVVDASGRLGEFLAIPSAFDDGVEHPAPDWKVLFDAAGLDMGAFTPAKPMLMPPVPSSTRAAWEGSVPELPEHRFRVEAAAHAGKPVYFAVAGPWSRPAREGPRPVEAWNRMLQISEALVMPGLMLASALLARRNLKLGRGDRTGAIRAATFVFVAVMIAWMLRPHVWPPGEDVNRFFATIGSALFTAGVLWLTYLGLEPFVRRNSPDSLIGWTRLVAGGWNDPRVGRDVMIGVSAGLAMTLIYAVHNLIPPLLGWPEPRPILMADWDVLLGTRHTVAHLIGRVVEAVQGAMFCVVGYVAFLLLWNRRWAAALTAIAVYTPVALNGMFSSGYLSLQIALGLALIAIFVLTIVRVGVLATAAALATHFVLIRAPLTTDFSSWRSPIGLWFLGTVLLAGLGACYIARTGTAAPQPAARAYAPQAG
jgi:serine/threonine-protein kinase